jgi:hypothetical protein
MKKQICVEYLIPNVGVVLVRYNSVDSMRANEGRMKIYGRVC